jgi:myo-inositol 2-dehydrogenase/D-chiro-inositol 1-dehydrogenase
MTSTGCLIILGSLLLLPLAMVGPPLGLTWTLFIPYLIPPALVLFVIMQTLRLGVRRPNPSPEVDQKGVSSVGKG